MNLYSAKGWKGLELWFDKTIGVKKYSSLIKSIIPLPIKRILKRYL
jgi:hypothetical protein